MSTPNISSDPVEEQAQPFAASLPTGANPLRQSDSSAPSIEKPTSSIRAPRPANLTWTQLREVEKHQSVEDISTETGFSNSGPVSPISPLGSSEALRTPNLTDRQKYSNKLPPSPGSTTQLPPRLHSPASQIFERNVQEDILPAQASPSIPAHIRTENYIPPVLEASSAAITDDQLDPDSVEIVTHSLHQSAVAGVTGPSTAEHSLASSGLVDHGMHSDTDEISSAYGALDTNDVRRLSFISFADVVNAEHAETGEIAHSREPSQGAPIPGASFAAGLHNRSPSPLRSPASSHALGTSPPTSISTSFKGVEMSPKTGPRTPGSPLALAQSPVSSNFGGELNVETMTQALRRTGSGDLGGVASQAASSFGNDEPLDRSL
ncbi:hypothetical protein N7468_008999 [Penicillium chermesinum]|uniref:Uncharacterized protein n=1 Tax=Penicillium chermesinum TaxID=63820 RepID=A0A9W9NGW4_9EURO|nr:uncharacterized protein N7468_008999 [Penicillium chermesinum]KAJ5219795.1 hypothetical protein N7468_008999 [Penicillium chermesinum]KAJ6153790.1 hypothetical protein N7470_006749 [Penicillium chermesinum]